VGNSTIKKPKTKRDKAISSSDPQLLLDNSPSMMYNDNENHYHFSEYHKAQEQSPAPCRLLIAEGLIIWDTRQSTAMK
jgi:hypothetical protein